MIGAADAVRSLLPQLANGGTVAVVADGRATLEHELLAMGIDAVEAGAHADAVRQHAPLDALVVGEGILAADEPAVLLRELALAAGSSAVTILCLPNATEIGQVGSLVLRGSHPPRGATPAQLAELVRMAGLREIASADLTRTLSDAAKSSAWPVPASSPIARFLESLRTAHDDTGATTTFVRAHVVLASPAAPVKGIAGQPSVSVLLRTQGERPTLADALLSLAAQTVEDFEVLALVHNDDRATVDAVDALVRTFEPDFARRVHVVHVDGGGRSRPLNVGLERAAGRLVAFLDDDDVVLAHWVETFAAHADGRIVRTRTVERDVAWCRPGEVGSWRVTSGTRDRWADRFDFVDHLLHNQSPVCSWAVPMDVVRSFRLRFDERLHRVEDWDFLLRAAALAGIRDVDEVTSIYHRWGQGERSSADHGPELWQAAYHVVLEKLDEAPLLLPGGSASKVAAILRTADAAEATASRVADLDERAREAGAASLDDAIDELEALRRRVDALERSRWWRWSRPVDAALRRSGLRGALPGDRVNDGDDGTQ